ncbi:MAG TPA: hypothetical protein DDZ61_11980 [Aeromonas salmonicida]|nr:hypothetical protein [Aeromonas salmonicida]HBL03310.1 hypothetical protein [Aeromonas salmonicida]
MLALTTPFMLAYAASEALARAAATPHQAAKTDRLNREPPSDGDGITAASLSAPDETHFPSP